MTEILNLLSIAGSWLQVHGSELIIAVVAAVVGAIASAIFDFRKHGVSVGIKLKSIVKDNSQHRQNADIQDGGHATQQEAGRDAVGQAVSGAESTAVLIAGDHNGDIILPNPPGQGTAQGLPYEENAFLLRITDILSARNVASTFSEHYRLGVVHLGEGHASLAAPAYHGAFRQIRSIFLERSTYSNDLKSEFLPILEGNFNKLAEFSDNGETDTNALRGIVSGLENTLKSMCAYIS